MKNPIKQLLAEGKPARGAAPFVRAWNHDPVSLARILDACAFGIVIPQIEVLEGTEKAR